MNLDARAPRPPENRIGSGGDLVSGGIPKIATLLTSLTDLNGRSFIDTDVAIDTILGAAREMLGLSTAVITSIEGNTWRAVRVNEDHTRGFRLQPGDVLPLDDTF